jgi:threonine/homoserine/homoserine lactone efflux protein
MDGNFFLKGMLLGFATSAPVGPIGILCIRRTVQYGRFSGLLSGFGAAFADVFYAAIAAFGLSFVSNFLMSAEFWLRLVGGSFLLYLGYRTFFTKVKVQAKVTHTSLLNDFISTFFLTLSNPMTLFFFLVIFAGLGLSDIEGSYNSAILLISGVFLGSACWWLFLSEGVTLFRKKVNQNLMQWINRIAGLMIVAFGVFVLLTLMTL